MAKAEIDDCIDTAIENIKNDRALALTLLADLMLYINKEDARHKEVGFTAAKYLETLQRSNEQLVKVSALLHKKNGQVNGLSDSDKEDLYSLIQENED
tara:strand:+ start:5947 stop:6240 length:294 start_codon:yes stop_codon:yes gene_type:complete